MTKDRTSYAAVHRMWPVKECRKIQNRTSYAAVHGMWPVKGTVE